ncbi:terminal protein [Rhodococcus qingshengii]|jgi:hypothetical protein|uniref:Terminal protein n=3 Tax=Actinomycetes TaxID=1760 RepID=A0ABV5XUU9_9NOCA|nr:MULTISPECIES: hypothetical protein [Rhodococcus]EEN87789.1 hypothetical protein RHOER0001_5909 [Rhodococcus erythropolis SK121]NHP18583.1 terminal protein [Rhodococcus sp. IC4_135]MBF7737333.1 terminal protein [Rhodococcus erythropolis]MBP1053875.1 terminal protein [Rhodococcus qingshengii]MBW0282347.1 terminal protein [Rhodococcus sp. FH8]
MARNPLSRASYSRIADSLSDFGSVVAGRINISRAAKELRVTQTAIREVLRGERGKLQGEFFGKLTGRQGADISGQPNASNLKAQLLAAYGPGKRSEINTAAAARDLGVSKRTVERWLAPEGRQRIAKPRTETLNALARKAKQSASTRTSRKEAMSSVRSSARGKALSNFGGKIKIDAVQGPGTREYARDRMITLALTPDQVESMWSAYENGGDKGMINWMNSRAQDYVGGWEFYQINSFDVER